MSAPGSKNSGTFFFHSLFFYYKYRQCSRLAGAGRNIEDAFVSRCDVTVREKKLLEKGGPLAYLRLKYFHAS
jgi:hypothetical protein